MAAGDQKGQLKKTRPRALRSSEVAKSRLETELELATIVGMEAKSYQN